MTIGDRIRRIRKKRRLTQAELAMMSGLSLSAIQGYEHGRYEPKRKSLESIAEVLKIPVDELYDMPAKHGTNLASLSTDCISRQAAIEALNGNITVTGEENAKAVQKYIRSVSLKIHDLPSAQPERTCVNCGRTVNNGGWYADGRTRCPIEEHYALPKDGYCHLWEKRNFTDDDYPERREE